MSESAPSTPAAQETPALRQQAVEKTALKVLGAISFAHMLNDVIQSVIPAIYPLLREVHALSYREIGFITFAFQFTASMLQPVVGMYTDRRPKPYSLAAGMGCTLVGLVLLSQAGNLWFIMAAAALVGTGSSVFHPEASRMAHMAAGGRHGFAQSLFQVGGNFGTSLGPLLAAWLVIPNGQGSIAWFTFFAAVGIVVLLRVGAWYNARLRQRRAQPAARKPRYAPLPTRRVAAALAVLVALVISKYIYLVSFTSYYALYLIDVFGVSKVESQLYAFVFLFAVAAGTFAGGPLGDRFGRKWVIWFSILGVAPFALVLPHVGLTATVILTVFIGMILASAFSAILVFAQELLPGRVGTVAGLFFGFAFGVSGIAAVALGAWADRTSMQHVFAMCAYLPLLGVLAGLLPKLEEHPL
ncbi:MAG: MFS transporter [Planctomycetota bacterium]|nr:MAG: MFS transporter [Planctomycetota bacterium]